MIMSNEYKDWLWDTSQEYVIENRLLKTIDSISIWDDGFLINGKDEYNVTKVYFVWLNDVDGWNYREIK